MSVDPTTGGARAPFGERLAAAMDEHGPLCVGIDPHPGLLSAWGLADDATGLREFALRVVDAVGGRVAALKPQAALFERHGSRGLAVLEDVIAAGRAAGTPVIVDAKRGDIGSTMEGYADAFLRDGSPLAGDALTVSPYLGFGSLRPAIEAALASGRGVFVLCLTSNTEGEQVQHARDEDGVSVAARIASEAALLNHGVDPLGSVGLVVGATIGGAAASTGTDLTAVNGPLLAPGVGAQGAGAAELAQVFGAARRQVLASSSRGVLAAGPDAGALRAAAAAASSDVRAALRG
ncbi:orotidine-5'-phosphate decarboxylase [Sediminihabitans luteus]|uniref:Orotidine 5'-phosphate decarboxylase n=1 Tax=Sediminihabitans luteus TaxID=1138585 RepID=A0A2M9CQL1_9CELL|nr:orotidine-5'-phosphate decarboxylase [Sediminihabitans luteus]PJJ74213.1 orotidine-5'-phosphate decarboxylase [Sediminihabitans luteus]GII99066.1 orotidine 5'-phosphate decarboxylase [Sediminihabitans luteus]